MESDVDKLIGDLRQMTLEGRTLKECAKLLGRDYSTILAIAKVGLVDGRGGRTTSKKPTVKRNVKTPRYHFIVSRADGGLIDLEEFERLRYRLNAAGV